MCVYFLHWCAHSSFIMIIRWHEKAVHLQSAGFYQWPMGMTVNPHWSRWVFNHQLRLCVAGKGRIRMPDGWQPLSRGACQWLRAGWEYEVECDPASPFGFLTIRFELRDPDGKRRSNHAGLPPEWLPGVDADYLEIEMKRIVGDVTRNREESFIRHRSGHSFCPMRRLRATSRLTALLMEIDERTFGQPRRPSPPVHPRVLRIHEIAHRICEAPGRVPPVDELAREAEYTRSHFCRAFKEIVGGSPQTFIIRVRLNHAQHLLEETSLSIKAIAAELGYRSGDFFSRQFRQHTGLSPKEFRRRHPPLI